MKKPNRAVYEIGALVRGHFRRLLAKADLYYGCEWKEEKGFLDSEFFVKGDPEAISFLNKQVKELGDG